MPDCLNCTENCPQAERAHETAKGRMYATQELVALVKKIESGQLVEVIRCKDCKSWRKSVCLITGFMRSGENFCSYGERRTDATD